MHRNLIRTRTERRRIQCPQTIARLGRRIDALNEMKDAAVQEANYEQAMLFRAAIEELDELRMSSQINQLVSAQFDLY